MARHNHGMRILVLLLLLPGGALALTSQDEADIRKAIEEQAGMENRKGSGELWNERGPVVYKVQKIEEIAPDVATAEANGWRTGMYPERRRYVFILTRSHDHWIIAKKVQTCPSPGMQLIM